MYSDTVVVCANVKAISLESPSTVTLQSKCWRIFSYTLNRSLALMRLSIIALNVNCSNHEILRKTRVTRWPCFPAK